MRYAAQSTPEPSMCNVYDKHTQMHITPLIANNFLIFDKPAEDYTNRALGFVLYYIFSIFFK